MGGGALPTGARGYKKGRGSRAGGVGCRDYVATRRARAAVPMRARERERSEGYDRWVPPVSRSTDFKFKIQISFFSAQNWYGSKNYEIFQRAGTEYLEKLSFWGQYLNVLL
jgi:hypothetical protein